MYLCIVNDYVWEKKQQQWEEAVKHEQNIKNDNRRIKMKWKKINHSIQGK